MRILLFCLLLINAPVAAQNREFRFEEYPSLDAMRIYIEKNFPLGTGRESMRKAFIEEGKARLVEHPEQDGVEKYLYDIDLCGKYVFRWNISADYDDDGKLRQAYINGRFVFMKGKEPRVFNFQQAPRLKSRMMQFPRPEIKDGRPYIRFRVFDLDGDFSTTNDQVATGPGPVKAFPPSIGETVRYERVELWRSIFDNENAGNIVPYPQCAGAAGLDPEILKLLGPEIQKLRDIQKQAKDIP